LKIAIFTDTFIPQVNGVARTVGRLAKVLAEYNISCMVLAPDTGLEGDQEYRVNFSPGFDLPVYQECKVAIPAYSAICREVEKFKPDVVHLVTEFSMGLCGLKYASSHNVPKVSSYHTNFPQYLSYYRMNFLTNWVWKYMRWFHNHCQINYCPSQATLKLLEKEGIANLDIWGRGIDTALFSPLKRDPFFKDLLGVQGETVLLYVGRIAPEKDLDILINAMRIINNVRSDIHLVIAGDGPQAAFLRRDAPPNVTFTGYLYGEELARVYASCDIFVFPSTTETYGNVVLEAMASGLPVVGAFSGGVKENLVNGFNGLACRSRNIMDMVTAIIELIENGGLRKTLALQARSYTLNKSWEKVFDKLIDGYFEVADKYNSKSA
jgi:glycosyltransferase involved in cell wall biosynthesis